MEPQLFPMRDVGKPREIVDGANIDRSGRSNDKKRREACAPIRRNGSLERVEVDMMALIRGDNTKGVETEAGDIHSLGNAGMGCRRHIGDEPLLALGNASVANCNTQRGSASDQHTQQVRHRCSGDEETGRVHRKSKQLAHPPDDLSLYLDRHVIASTEIGIEAGSEHLRQHAGWISAAMHPTHKARMGIPGGIGKDIAHELLMDCGKIGRRRG